MAKLTRPPILVFLTPGAIEPPMDAEDGYYRTGKPLDGQETAISRYVVLWCPPSDVLYERELSAIFAKYHWSIHQFYCPFKITGPWANGQPRPALLPSWQLPKWGYRAFRTLPDMVAFVYWKYNKQHGGIPKNEWPTLPVREQPPEWREEMKDRACKLGLKVGDLDRSVSRGYEMWAYEKALTTPHPAPVSRLLHKGVPLAEIMGSEKLRPENRAKVEKYAESVGTTWRYMARVLRGQALAGSVRPLPKTWGFPEGTP